MLFRVRGRFPHFTPRPPFAWVTKDASLPAKDRFGRSPPGLEPGSTLPLRYGGVRYRKATVYLYFSNVATVKEQAIPDIRIRNKIFTVSKSIGSGAAPSGLTQTSFVGIDNVRSSNLDNDPLSDNIFR